MKALIILATVWSLGFGGGATNPHSECDSDSCLDNGVMMSVQAEAHTRANRHLSLRYGVSASYMEFSQADRETSSQHMENKRRDWDLVLSFTAKPTVTIFDTVGFFPIIGYGADTSQEWYTILGVGLDLKLNDHLFIEVQNTETRAKCTWHRTSTIGVRYEF